MFIQFRLFLFYKLLRFLQIENIGGHYLYKKGLNAQSTIIDAGANVGSFSKTVKHRFACRCIAIEPVQVYFDQIENNIEKFNGLLHIADGQLPFTISEELEASSVYTGISERLGNVGEQTFIPALSFKGIQKKFSAQAISLLKLDIEGAEIDVLNHMPDADLIAIPQLSIEFHDFILPEQSQDIENLRSRLKALGFVEIRASRNFLMDMVYLNSGQLKLSPFWHLLYRIFSRVSFPYHPVAFTGKSVAHS